MKPVKENVESRGSWTLLRETGCDQLLCRRDAVGARSSRLGQCPLNEVTGSFIHVLDGHELLVPHDLLCAVGCGDAHDVADVLKNTKAVGNIFPEKARVFVKNDAIWYAWILGNHWELHPGVAQVRIEDPLEAARVSDLSLVHRADPLRDR